jgi:uncharacterized protein
MNKEPTPGLYRHYKGGEYRVIGTARHSETDELLVVYRCLCDNDSLWVRPLAMFCETVTVDGVEQPRFRLIQTSFTAKDAEERGELPET